EVGPAEQRHVPADRGPGFRGVGGAIRSGRAEVEDLRVGRIHDEGWDEQRRVSQIDSHRLRYERATAPGVSSLRPRTTEPLRFRERRRGRLEIHRREAAITA